MNIRLSICAMMGVLLATGSANAEVVGELERPGMLVQCFFDQPNGFKAAVAIFIPSTGVKDKAVVPDQVRNPDGLLSSSGFDHVKIANDKTEFSGKNRMTLTFLGGEIYRAELRPASGLKQKGACVVLPYSSLTEAMKIFDEVRLGLNRQNKDGATK